MIIKKLTSTTKGKVDNFYYKVKTISFFILLLFVILLANNRLLVSTTLREIHNQTIAPLFGNPETSVTTINDLKSWAGGAILGLWSKPKMPQLNMTIKQKELLKLINTDEGYYNGEISLSDGTVTNEVKAKFRKKGDRELHRESITQMSYRVKMKAGTQLLGMRKFSIQRPILRGYTWELLLAKIARSEGLLSLNSIPVEFKVNGDSRGVYILEEVPTDRTLEKQSRKSGPIFGLEERLGISLASKLDVYDSTKWVNSPIYISAKRDLDLQFFRALNKKTFDPSIFDFDEWAKYFALNDLFGTYHGTIPKSVKFYFNTVDGKFQPLLFDAHKGAGNFNDFILEDFIARPAIAKCDWICSTQDFYLAFLNNKDFYEIYRKYLIAFSKEAFVASIINIYNEEYRALDNYFYSRFSMSDAIFSSGLSLYFFKVSELGKRAALIRKRIEAGNDRVQFYHLQKEVDVSRTTSDINYDEKTVDVKSYINARFINEDIMFQRPTIVRLKGDTVFQGESKENPLVINGNIMLVQEGGSINLKNVTFKYPINIPVQNRNWSGALNLIKTNAVIDNLKIQDSRAEDALNIVSSRFDVKNISIERAKSDAIDFDFSNGSIDSVICVDIGNDCLDGSESRVDLGTVNAKKVADKVISAGENSKFNVSKLTSKLSGISMVSKDGSFLNIDSVESIGDQLGVTCFTKKSEYVSPAMSIRQVVGSSFVAYISTDCEVNFPTSVDVKRLQSSEIDGLLYGNQYGVKTVK